MQSRYPLLAPKTDIRIHGGQVAYPRNPKIDAVDWVERIPLAETRNYVQRVMENLGVPRALRRQHHDGRAQFTPSGDDRVTRHGAHGNTCRGRGRGHAARAD